MSGYLGNPMVAFYGAGPSVNGTLIQLAACGIATAMLTGKPSLTFWRTMYLQYTNFAMLSIVQTFEGQVAFGSTATCKIFKAGDLLYFLYVLIGLPGIRACPQPQGGCGTLQQFPYAIDASNPCAQTDAEYFSQLDGGASYWLFENYGSCGDYEDSCAADACGFGGCAVEPFAYWTNAIGQVIVKTATLIIGTQTIDTLYNDFLFMWEELAGKPGKRLTEMIGKRYCREDLIVDSSASRTLYVPLPFYFTMTPGNALPLVAAMFSGVQIIVQFEQLQSCIIVSGPEVQVVKCNGGGPILATDIIAAIDGTQVFLDTVERDRFAVNWFEQLIVQHFPLYQSVCCQSARIALQFAHPVVELVWAVRRKCQADHNNWFNYSGILGREPIVSAALLFNGTARQPEREGSWYRLVQPYQFHTCIPEACIYCYSFALYPEEAQPSGACNFSRLENVTLLVNLQEGLQREDVMVIIFCLSLNMLRWRDGVGGLAFSA